MIKDKPCRPTGRAAGFKSCGDLVLAKTRTYGLCPKCLKLWAKSTPEGLQYTLSLIPKARKQVEQTKKDERRKLKIEIKSGDVMKLADMYFSRYIRLIHSEDGFCTCHTCGTIKEIKEVDNGHYIKREHKSVRYDENNCRPQCKTCNGDIKHNGKQIEFRANLVREIGLINVTRLESAGKLQRKANGLFYKEKADYYRQKVNEIQKELGIKYW
ncbi:MAG: hypothetical protein GY679_00155 [Mycoplasma sp.]|nr:hypothetical protein [Mycoplasma sp.]